MSINMNVTSTTTAFAVALSSTTEEAFFTVSRAFIGAIIFLAVGALLAPVAPLLTAACAAVALGIGGATVWWLLEEDETVVEMPVVEEVPEEELEELELDEEVDEVWGPSAPDQTVEVLEAIEAGLWTAAALLGIVWAGVPIVGIAVLAANLCGPAAGAAALIGGAAGGLFAYLW